MNPLRRLLHVVSGWFAGLAFALAWVWVGEGKTEPVQTGGLYIVLAILMTTLSLVLLGSTLVQLAAYMLDGEER